MARNVALQSDPGPDESIDDINSGLMPEVFQNNGRPLIIAGPCSAESENQILATACRLKQIDGISVFRAGLWKPRTRPNCFEGVGSKGLAWLSRVKQQTGLWTSTEVASARHIEHCLRGGVDLIWIGARTTVNPFMIAEIAEALRGTDIPVLVKNPINPEISLWIGAIERLFQKGVRRIAAIHRGFSYSPAGKMRNDPNWSIPIELKRHLPSIPLICDPSHMAGCRDLIKPLAQMALDFGMDGLMVESHHEPSQALSDAAQQLKPVHLQNLLADLRFRREGLNGRHIDQNLRTLRKKINRADTKIIAALSERMDLVRGIGELKRAHNIPVFQLERWNDLQTERISQGSQLGLEAHFIKGLFDLIHAHAVEAQF